MRSAQSVQRLLACIEMPLLYELALHNRGVADTLRHHIMERLSEFPHVAERPTVIGDGSIFLEIHAESKDREDWRQAAQVVLKRLSEPYAVFQSPSEGRSTDVILSVFCGLFPLEPNIAGGDTRHARMAASKARQMSASSEGVVVIYDEALRTTNEKTLAHKQIVLTALGQGTLQVFYQPKICLTSGEIKGFEALIRPPKEPMEPWASYAGHIGALEIITAVNALNLMAELTLHVLDTTNKDLQVWDALYPECKPTVSINVPPNTLIQGWPLISKALERVFDPSRIIIEITEHDLEVGGDSERLNESINKLRDKGFGVAIDDFGIGHSNLTRLTGLPFTELKLDRALTQSLTHNPMSHTLVRQLVSVTKHQNLQIIAEGVETSQERDIVKALGINMAQGFLFGKPESAPQVTKQLGIQFDKRSDNIKSVAGKASGPTVKRIGDR